MTRTVRQKIQDAVNAALARLQAQGVVNVPLPAWELTPPKNAEHGDFACSLPLQLAKPAKQNPRALAAAIQEALGDAGGLLERTEIAGPGFLNFVVHANTWRDTLAEILAAGSSYVRSDTGRGERVLVEFVSANPTGPLHVAHGRGAVMGDLLARLLTVAGYAVTREYYVNDLGHQVDVLALSVHLRYGELFGRTFTPPEDFYPGDYVTDIARAVRETDGERWLDAPESVWLDPFRKIGVATMLERIRADLDVFGVRFDRYVSERELTERRGLQQLLERLEQGGHVYVQDGKKWFRSTALGDDKDRVVERENGVTTYFASDIAYHDDKLQRADRLINIWGADHGGYVARVKAGIGALGHAGDPLEVVLVQMVSLSSGGETVRMGKRLGTAVWLRDVVREVGRDACRYFFAMRRADAQMDFDLDLATKKTLDNPVYYAQMGHARMCSIARKARAAGIPDPVIGTGVFAALTLPEELGLIKTMARAPELVAQAARDREPHQVVHYIQELIGQFHSYYTQYKNTDKVVGDDPDKTRARLLLCQALQGMLRTMLEDVLGVTAPESMTLEEDAA